MARRWAGAVNSRVRLPAHIRHVIDARRTVGRMAHEAGLDRERIDDLMLAVSEAVTNAIEAQLAKGVLDDLLLTCRAEGGRLLVTLEDRAGGFDREAKSRRKPLSDAVHLDHERGWGLQLIESLVDGVAFEPTEAGTTVRLVVEIDTTGRRADADLRCATQH